MIYNVNQTFLDELDKLRAENSNNKKDMDTDMVNISQSINKMDKVDIAVTFSEWVFDNKAIEKKE